MEYSYSFLILLLPFLSFLVLGLLGMKMKKPVAGFIGTAVLGVLWCMSLYTAYEYFFAVGRDAATGLYPTVTVFNFTWLKFTDLLTFNIGFRLTPISVMMLIVITTVSSWFISIASAIWLSATRTTRRKVTRKDSSVSMLS
jgi:NADH-quinone oxidoreductase subunit L